MASENSRPLSDLTAYPQKGVSVAQKFDVSLRRFAKQSKTSMCFGVAITIKTAHRSRDLCNSTIWAGSALLSV